MQLWVPATVLGDNRSGERGLQEVLSAWLALVPLVLWGQCVESTGQTSSPKARVGPLTPATGPTKG